MRGHVLVAQGDITQIAAHAVGYSTDKSLSPGGQLTSAFIANFPTFAAKYASLAAEVKDRQLAAGDSFWLAMDPTVAPHGVIVTVATGVSAKRVDRAHTAVSSALACAARSLAEKNVPKPWLIALPAYLTGHGGARHDRLTVAEPQIEAAYEFVDANDGVDVAFIPYTEGTYQVWLDARRRVEARRPPGDDIELPEELTSALSRGEGVVFVGAGVSMGSGLPSWQGLIDELGNALGLHIHERRTDLEYLLDLAQWYRDQGLQPTLEALVAKRFASGHAGARPTLAHYLLTSLPARFFVTTNYDDLLEVALRALRRYPERIVTEEDVARTGRRDTCYVVKFHGCASEGGAVVLGRDDYDEFFRNRPAMALLLEGLLLNQTFFFVGYGLRDPDFRQILSRIATLLRGAKRLAFATTFDATRDHARKQWRNKHLELLDVEGGSVSDKARRLNHVLDRLGEIVARDPHLFLAGDMPALQSPQVEGIRTRLIDLSSDLWAACSAAITASRSDVLALVDLVRFFAGRGWRGIQPGHLSGLFTALAVAKVLTPEERRELLVLALRHTESSSEVKRLELAIADLDAAIERDLG